MKRMTVAASLAGLLLCSSPLPAQSPEQPTTPKPQLVLKTNQFDYEYVEPKNPAHRELYEMLKASRLLEKFQEFFSPIKLPERIVLRTADCDGVANAYFFNDEIKVCYEYFKFMMRHSPKMEREGLSPKDALIGPTVEVFLHEVGHAMLQLLDIPFFGREEDAADYIAAFIMLQFCGNDSRRLILGASFISGSEAMEEEGKAPQLVSLADVHSLPAVRHFNRWCMAYGYNKELFADALTMGKLPPHRARNCRYEYIRNEMAYNELVRPYIDGDMLKVIHSRSWFNFESPVPPMMTAPVAAVDQPAREPAARR